MIAILTRFIPATNTRPARIKAYTINQGQSLVMPCEQAVRIAGDGSSFLERSHGVVAQALADRHGWTGRLIAGETQHGFAFVFAD